MRQYEYKVGAYHQLPLRGLEDQLNWLTRFNGRIISVDWVPHGETIIVVEYPYEEKKPETKKEEEFTFMRENIDYHNKGP